MAEKYTNRTVQLAQPHIGEGLQHSKKEEVRYECYNNSGKCRRDLGDQLSGLGLFMLAVLKFPITLYHQNRRKT